MKAIFYSVSGSLGDKTAYTSNSSDFMRTDLYGPKGFILKSDNSVSNWSKQHTDPKKYLIQYLCLAI